MLDPAIKFEFQMPEGHYFLSHSVGCLPHSAVKALETSLLSPWAELGGGAWPGWLASLGDFQTEIAGLIGADAGDICPQTNVSAGFARILQSLPRRPGRDRLVLSEEDFPSLGFVAQAAERLGYRLDFVPAGEASEDPASWERILGEDVQLALVTHAFSNRSALLPVDAITRSARRLGIFSVVDAVQTLGVIPIDVDAWEADFVLGSSVKFLCGGPGAAFLWARPETATLCAPVDTGWFSHEDPFAFDIHDFRPRRDAWRFMGGTPSVAPFVMATAALKALRRIGVPAIKAHNQALIDQLHNGLGRHKIASAMARERRGNAVLIRVQDPASAMARLGAAGFHADARSGAIRVSPHLYNSAEDVGALITVMHGQ